MSLFRFFFCVCFLPTLCLYSNPTYSAGGIPLHTDLSLQQQLIIEAKASLERKKNWQLKMEHIVPRVDLPHDPEYQAILEDYDRRKEAFKLSHRDLQWHVVAKVMRNIEDVDDRLGLIHTVRNNPLWRQLSPTVAITSVNLANWNIAKKMFLKHLRRAK